MKDGECFRLSAKLRAVYLFLVLLIDESVVSVN